MSCDSFTLQLLFGLYTFRERPCESGFRSFLQRLHFFPFLNLALKESPVTCPRGSIQTARPYLGLKAGVELRTLS